MRQLNISYKFKDVAKDYGAVWNAAAKKWCAPTNLNSFQLAVLVDLENGISPPQYNFTPLDQLEAWISAWPNADEISLDSKSQ